MSKKSRQSRARQAAQVSGSAPGAPAPAVRPTRESGFNPDYTYVRKDLRRIGLLAGTFILLMVVAALLLR